MTSLRELVQTLIELRRQGRAQVTLLAVCPNSDAVLEAAVLAAAHNRMPMLFAATLNQIDLDGGYTGWTPAGFVHHLRTFAARYGAGQLYPCLDHGGPWLKDAHTRDRLSLDETMQAVRDSVAACIDAGYSLLHIDPTVDRTLPPDAPVPIDLVVERTVGLIADAEEVRVSRGLPPVAYEVGTEEVHGGLVDMDAFTRFLHGLHAGLAERDLLHAWPSFIVGKVGTDLHTTDFDPVVAQQLYELAMPYGSLIKGHYTDWVANPEDYPKAGMGGANVGPEFTAVEYVALADLVKKEAALCISRPSLQPSGMMAALEQAVEASGRWRKWLQPDEVGMDFAQLHPARRTWLAQTGARYIWTDVNVVDTRQRLYANLANVFPDPHHMVVARIAQAIDAYVNAFGLFDASHLLDVHPEVMSA